MRWNHKGYVKGLDGKRVAPSLPDLDGRWWTRRFRWEANIEVYLCPALHESTEASLLRAIATTTPRQTVDSESSNPTTYNKAHFICL
ncbi:hypothetical protein EVAR_21691_1 [Eumeta japonica]|uniref:Uncharacterized protein n=1 Tax=Eumeta variegata TaxID=151549 RepID=A0A4C1W4V7_EUMVA|nr:hypothetical protein EVAR_21691_1 [Eumeta japonica]